VLELQDEAGRTLQQHGVTTDGILEALSTVRGSQRVTDPNPEGKYEALEWLMFQMASIGPGFGQAHHFLRFAKEKVPYAIERFGTETRRLYGVMDARLEQAPYLAGEYGIADIATFPWVARHEFHEVDLALFPAVKRWYDEIAARPAVQRGMKVPG